MIFNLDFSMSSFLVFLLTFPFKNQILKSHDIYILLEYIINDYSDIAETPIPNDKE